MTSPSNAASVMYNVPTAVPDANAAGVNIPLSVTDVGTIAGLSLTIAMSHTFIGDLVLRLHNPSNTQHLTLMHRPGKAGSAAGFGDNANLSSSFPISFFDGASANAEQMGNASTSTSLIVCGGDGICSFAPNPNGDGASNLSNFAGFTGSAAFGIWLLNVSDNEGADTGSINSVTLNYQLASVAAVPVPAALPLFATGLGALAFLARRKRKTAAAA
jgi:subtilisin-like proprotein convertase family protein